MKNIKRRIIIGGALFVALWTAQTASAWYDPSTGRWLTRDPIGEPGFEVLQRVKSLPQIAAAASPSRWIHRSPPEIENRYLFVGNNPINFVDYLGLEKKGTGVKWCASGKHQWVEYPGGSAGYYPKNATLCNCNYSGSFRTGLRKSRAVMLARG